MDDDVAVGGGPLSVTEFQNTVRRVGRNGSFPLQPRHTKCSYQTKMPIRRVRTGA